MIQKIGGHDEKGGLSSLDAAIGYRHSQMGLTGTAGTGESQPPLGFFSEPDGGIQSLAEQRPASRVGQGAFLLSVGEGNAAERTKVTVTAQRGHPGGRLRRLLAFARKCFAKVWVAHRDFFG